MWPSALMLQFTPSANLSVVVSDLEADIRNCEAMRVLISSAAN